MKGMQRWKRGRCYKAMKDKKGIERRGEREKGKIDRRIEETLYKPLIWSHKLRKEKIKRKVARRESASNPRHEAIKTETPYELTGGIASFKMAARKH